MFLQTWSFHSCILSQASVEDDVETKEGSGVNNGGGIQIDLIVSELLSVHVIHHFKLTSIYKNNSWRPVVDEK